ncbi:MAG: hypothetical protein WD875_10935 [Pirellulales bacterium]
MKAERRHELQHNQLAEWLARKTVAVRPYITTIFVSMLAVVAVWVAYSWYSSSTAAAKSETWNRYYTALDAFAAGDDAPLRDFVSNHVGEPAGLVARQRLAMFQMSSAAARQLSSRDASRLAYQEAIDNFIEVRAATNVETLKRYASYQIAQARESRYDLDEAIKDYEAIVEKWPESMEAEQAKLRLADLKNPETKKGYEWHRTVNPTVTPPTAPTTPVAPATNLDDLPDAPPADAAATPAADGSKPAAPKATVPDDGSEPGSAPSTDATKPDATKSLSQNLKRERQYASNSSISAVLG